MYVCFLLPLKIVVLSGSPEPLLQKDLHGVAIRFLGSVFARPLIAVSSISASTTSSMAVQQFRRYRPCCTRGSLSFQLIKEVVCARILTMFKVSEIKVVLLVLKFTSKLSSIIFLLLINF